MKISQIRQLHKNWDTYQSDPPSVLACDIAEYISKFHVPSFICPTGDQSIILKYQKGTRSIVIEIDPDGDLGMAITDLNLCTKYIDYRNPRVEEVIKELHNL